MSNPFSNLITSDFKDIFTNMIDALLEDDSLTVPCRLIYEGSKWTECNNCLVSPISGRSASKYRSGGPVAFSGSVCPVCNNIGRIVEHETETIYLAVLWDYKNWIGNVKVNSPEGSVQTISKIDTADQIKRANEIVIDTNIENYVKHVFVRNGEPTPYGLGTDSYIFTMWARKK